MKNPKNKFYVAADKMIDDPENWRRNSFNAAVGHAKQILTRDIYKKEVLIVKVVAIVTREEAPVKIEKVK